MKDRAAAIGYWKSWRYFSWMMFPIMVVLGPPRMVTFT
jgi:hypothetical protein